MLRFSSMAKTIPPAASRRPRLARQLLVAAFLFGLALPASGQNYPRTRLETVTPPGGKAGTTVEVVIGGDDLEDVKGLYFSDARLKAELVPPPTPDPRSRTRRRPRSSSRSPSPATCPWAFTTRGPSVSGASAIRAPLLWATSTK
jgi:hypothetical protein